MAGHPSCTSPGRHTSPYGGHAGRALPGATTFAPGDRMAHTLQVARGLSGMHTPPGASLHPSPSSEQCVARLEHPKRNLRRSGIRSSRTDTISAVTGSSSARWLAATGGVVIFGGVLKSSGARGCSSPVVEVRALGLSPLLDTGIFLTGLTSPHTPGVNHGIAQDGRVAILTILRV